MPQASAPIRTPHPTFHDIQRRKLIFVSGKGGVGKTAVSQALALSASRVGRKTLWVSFEDPTRNPGELSSQGPNLWHLNADASKSFEEYAALKIGMGALARVFVSNNLVRYLAKAVPGIHELVLLDKVWNERLHHDCVVVDMPSTGYGVTMFQSTANFANLFRGGPVNRDAEAMLLTFGSPGETGHLIVALPEEMPLQEGLELNELLVERFPSNPPAFLVNRRFPGKSAESLAASPSAWANPVPDSAADYAHKRRILEEHNLRIWRQALSHSAPRSGFFELPFLAPEINHSTDVLVGRLAELLSVGAP